MSRLVHFYRKPALSPSKKSELLSLAKQRVSPAVEEIETEYCFYIETTAPLTDQEKHALLWLLSETFEQENFSDASFLENTPPNQTPEEERQGNALSDHRGRPANEFQHGMVNQCSVGMPGLRPDKNCPHRTFEKIQITLQ